MLDQLMDAVPEPEDDAAAPFRRLSQAARVAWAKHDRQSDGWLPLWRHMADSGAVAGRLWGEWVPTGVCERVAESLPGGERDAALLIRFLATAHDAGKASPAFACQVDALADVMRDAGLEMRTAKAYGQDRRLAPHGLAGQLLLQEWMEERYGLRGRVAGQFAVVAGGHHGTPPEHQQIHDLQLRPHLLRHPGPSEERWRSVQFELLDACAESAGVAERLGAWRGVRLPQPVQVLLTAVVILSDWIASAPELFPYDPESWEPLGPVGERRRLLAAWRGLDLPGPWRPEEPGLAPTELFAERFPKLRGAAIRPVQAESVRVAREMPAPGLLMIEAPMGEGKTEAALAAAEVLAARSGAGGLLFALPTRATGDAMFPRLLAWLDQLPRGGSESWSAVLAHAKAGLNEAWAGMLKQGQRAITAVDPDSPEEFQRARPEAKPTGLHAHQWLRGKKKQLLASFAVGTVDQLLFAGLKSRHLALRHLAVAGKVVVIDEVHAYDAYMSRYLDRVLEWLAAYRVPVVLLSATLPSERRRALAAAYAGEAGAEVEVDADAYPLVTAVAPGQQALTARPAAAGDRGVEVMLERVEDDVEVLADRIAEELADGGCALVVRNTVDRVREAARALRERFGDEAVTVAHSRFLAADRAVKDADLVHRFGPDGDARPERHVVVASQVVEQSLDVDFDLMATDLAPVDLVLQRMGRLHRHARTRPERLRQARCLVTGADWETAPPTPDKGSEKVYKGRLPLLASSIVLAPHLDGQPLRLPADISPLAQRAYGTDLTAPEGWAEALAKARDAHTKLMAEKRDKAAGFLLGPVRRAGRPVYGWLEAHAGDADDTSQGRAQVRDSEESLEVLVIQRRADGRLTTVPWLDGGRGGLELPTDFPPTRKAAEAVAASALTLPRFLCRPPFEERTLDELEEFHVPAWQVKECPWLAGELFLVLDEDCQTHVSGFDLTYSQADGLGVEVPGREGREPSAGRGSGTSETGRGDGQGGGERAQDTTAERQGEWASPPRLESDAVSVAEEEAPAGPPAFNLVDAAWLPVQRMDGAVEEVSLRELFVRAGEFRRLAGDLPTQDFALLRLLLAVLYDALDEAEKLPEELEDWEDLWLDPEASLAEVPDYLERHRGRFELFDSEAPFYQVAGLRTAKAEVAPLSRIVSDVPVGAVFFSMRRPGVDRLSYAEAARWLVHTHAYDTSGIKPALVGDEARAKAGKVYPLGVGSLGGLGGVFAEGDTLQETLLLNVIATEESEWEPDSDETDVPVWRRPPLQAAPRESGRPAGLRDLYTWQSRRVRLHAEGGAVTGVVLGYGDPLALSSPWTLEPMTSWRRSPFAEKKQRRTPVYVPQRHDPAKSAWRGLAALLPAGQRLTDSGKRGEAASTRPSGIARWLARIITEGDVDAGKLIRLRLVGAEYGTQQSVVDEVVDDSVVLPVIALHEKNKEYGGAALDGARWAEDSVIALGQLADNLAKAAGTDGTSPAASARDLGFGALDGPYRGWLRDLLTFPDLETAREEWRAEVRRRVAGLGRQLVASAGPAADEGRTVKVNDRDQWVDAGRAYVWFTGRLNAVLGTGGKRAGSDGPDDVRDKGEESK